MSNLTEVLGQAITGRLPVTEHDSLGIILNALVGAAGSAAGAARALGVSPTTFYRWRNSATDKTGGVHQTPKLGKRIMISALRHMQAPPSRMRPLIRGEQRLVLDAEVQISNDVRRRKVAVGRVIPPRKMGNVLRAWQAGDDERADRLLTRHIEENYVADMRILHVHRGWFE